MNKSFYQMPLEELGARIIAETDTLLLKIQTSEIVGTSSNMAVVARSAAALCGGNCIAASDGSQHWEIALSVLKRCLDEETLETRQVFDGKNDEEEGAIGIIYNQRVLTVVGEQVSHCIQKIEVLSKMHCVFSARVEAERTINRKLHF